MRSQQWIKADLDTRIKMLDRDIAKNEPTLGIKRAEMKRFPTLEHPSTGYEDTSISFSDKSQYQPPICPICIERQPIIEQILALEDRRNKLSTKVTPLLKVQRNKIYMNGLRRSCKKQRREKGKVSDWTITQARRTHKGAKYWKWRLELNGMPTNEEIEEFNSLRPQIKALRHTLPYHPVCQACGIFLGEGHDTPYHIKEGLYFCKTCPLEIWSYNPPKDRMVRPLYLDTI